MFKINIFTIKNIRMSFIVYKASAGSGKTFNLAKEYLKIVLQNPDDFKHILAITFTNKAANEMKSRIIDYLAGISATNPDSRGKKDMLPLLISETGLGENEIIIKCGIILRKILYNYADFSIMTIDKFFQKIVRSFSYDLNIPINYRLEINMDEMVEQIVDNLLDLVGENKEISEILIQYINKMLQDNKSWHIESKLANFSKEIFKESAYFSLNTLKNIDISNFIESIHLLRNGLHEIRNEIQSQANKAINLITSSNISLDDFSQKSSGVGHWFNKVSKGTYSYNSYVQKAIYDDIWFAKNKEPLQFGQIKPTLTEIGDNIIKNIQLYNDLLKILDEIYGVALINQIKNVIQNLKDEEGMFFLSETNFTLADVIKNQPTPFIYERIGEKYFHYFIDEFQDTSKLQWNNMIPLIIEAISSLHNGKKGSAILFGDAKQSIYRFRDADFTQFIQLPKTNIDDDPLYKKYTENILSSNFQIKSLNYNYRTKTKIVEFNNQLFEIVKNYLPNFDYLYQNHAQKTIGDENEGLVDISVFEYTKDGKIYTNDTNQRIFNIVQNLKSERFEFKDIAILGRDKNHLRDIASFLISNNISVISSDSLQLNSSADVRFLKQMIHFFKSNNNELVNVSIIRYVTNLDNDQLFQDYIAYAKSIELMQSFFLKVGYNINFDLCYHLNIYDLCEEIIRIFFKDKNQDSYVIGFIDIIHKYHIDQKSESEFSQWWENEKSNFSIALPDGIDGIRIQTVHAAKGLEFPIVILPYYSSRNKPSSIWVNTIDEDGNPLPHYNLPIARITTSGDNAESVFNKDIENEKLLKDVDEINIAYVALTRPIERLYILSQTPSESSLNKKDYSFSKLLNDFIQFHPEYLVENEQNDFKHYQIGIPKPKIIKHEERKNMIVLNKNVSTYWYNSTNFNYEQPESEAIEWGNIFHYAMQFVSCIDDVNFAINKTKSHFNLSESKTLNLKQLIESTYYNKLINKYFSKNNRVLNERSIVDKNGKIFRPDRIVLHKDKAVVIDFKTGVAYESHQEQINNYKNLLNEIGYDDVKAFVVYVQMDQVDVMEY